MAKLGHRIFAGFFAGLFLLTSSALTIAIVLQGSNNDKNKPNEANTEVNKVDPSKQLQGKPLAGYVPTGTPITSVQSTDTKVGNGETVKPGATITFHYTGALASTGTVFQSSHDTGKAVTFPLSQLIKGWQEGIPGMKVGGERRLLIPYAQGYGEQGTDDGSIPPKSDLVFDIEVTAVKNP